MLRIKLLLNSNTHQFKPKPLEVFTYAFLQQAQLA